MCLVKTSLCVVVLCLVPELVCASPVVSSSCTVSTLGVTTSAGCGLSYGAIYTPSWTYADAYIEGAATISGNVITAFIDTEVQVASAVPGNVSSGASSVSFTDSYYVNAPPTAGLLEITPLANPFNGTVSAAGNASSWTVSVNGNVLASSSCTPQACVTTPANLWLPVTLGGWSFTFTGFASSSLAVGYGAPADSHAATDNIVTLGLFEADGVTPVPVADATPEPNSWAFLVGASFALPLLARRAAA